MSATAARRSTSLTRSSPTSKNTVVPWATAAATARMGISSSEGISAAGHVGRLQRRRGSALTRMVACRPDASSASVSPPGTSVTSAPMRSSTLTKPSRAGPLVDVGHVDRAAGDHGAGHGEERGGGGVARHGALDRLERRGPDRDDAAFAPRLDRDVRAGLGQHLLGVRPVVMASRTTVAPLGREPGQEDGRLHLRAGHLRGPVDPAQRAAPHAERRQAARAVALDRRAHLVERLGHPVHRPLGEGLVADELGPPGQARDEAGQEPHGGAGVPTVERVAAAGGAGSGPRADDRPLPSSPARRATPMASTAASDAATSAPSESPCTTDVPSASAARRTERCEIDFSPGVRTVPRQGTPPSTTRMRGAAARHDRCSARPR